MPTIKSLVDDIIASNPDLAEHRVHVEKAVKALLRLKPNVAVDEAFISRLRADLLDHPEPQTNRTTSMFMKFAFVVLALGVALPVAAIVGFMSMNGGVSEITNLALAPKPTLTTLERGAFGDLADVDSISTNGFGAGGGLGSRETMSSVAPVPAMDSSTKNCAADTRCGTMIAPGEPYPMTMYTYTFDGDLSEYLKESSGDVYRRVQPERPKASVLSSILSSLSPFNASAFGNGNLTSLSISKDKYDLSLEFNTGSWNIYRHWEAWAQPTDWTPLTAEQIPSDEEMISIAKAFANDMKIDLTKYGEPVISYSSPLISARAGFTADGSALYVPEAADVVFHVKVDGQVAHENWNNSPTGLRISVNFRDKGVNSAVDNMGQSFEKSAYTLTQDAELVGAIMKGGGSVQQVYEGAEVEEIKVALKAPERVLMSYSDYKNGTWTSLFIPALRFELVDPNQTPWTSSNAIFVPLVDGIAKQSGASGDMVKIMSE